jgi:putative two-component system response regulator
MLQNGGKPTVIVVDDEATNLSVLNDILQDDFNVRLSPSGERALAFMEKRAPDLLLLDIQMPGMNGFDVIRAVKKRSDWQEIPIIILTGREDREAEELAFNLGAVDYIRKPISAGVVKARVRLHVELESHRKNLEGLIESRTRRLEKTQDALLDVLANMTSFRDNETGAHIKRTTIFTRLILDALMEKRHPNYLIELRYADAIVKAAKLHDIGKVAIPDRILFKPAKLTVEEFEIIKKHSKYGVFILDAAINELEDEEEQVPFFLAVAREIVIGHHEKWNGSGYPDGLKGESIPLSARIMAIADVYDALISERPYKKPFSHETSMNIILKDAGTHFDPTLIELSLDAMENFPDIALLHKDDHSFEIYEKMFL